MAVQLFCFLLLNCFAWVYFFVGVFTVLIKSVTVDNYKVSEVKLLGVDHKINWEQNEEGLSVKLPKKLPSKIGYVLDIRIRTKH